MPLSYNTNRRQYVLKTSGGECLHLFYKPYEGICCSVQTGDFSWGLPSIIVRNALPGFSAYLDKSDGIHILCQDSKGNILYAGRQDRFWHTQQVTRNKDTQVYDKYPGIYANSSGITLFYIHDDREKRVLVSQRYIQPDTLSSPKMVDTIKKNSSPFFVQGAPDGTVYLFYVRPGEKHDSSGYRILPPDNRDWGDFIEISRNSDAVREQILAVAEDPEGEFNIALQRILPHKYDLAYIKTRQGQKYQEPDTLLSSSAHPFSSSSLVISGQTRIVYWHRDDTLNFCLSRDGGKTWGNAEKYKPEESAGYSCIRYFSNFNRDVPEMCGNDIPASLSEGFLTAFRDEIKNAEQGTPEQPDRTAGQEETDPAQGNGNGDKSKKSLIRTMETLEGNLREINNKLLDTEEKQKKLEGKLQELEQVVETHTEEIKKTGQVLERLKSPDAKPKPVPTAAPEQSAPRKTAAQPPLMSGTGFAHITYDFLKNYNP